MLTFFVYKCGFIEFNEESLYNKATYSFKRMGVTYVSDIQGEDIFR